jgi:hypothetical protein
MNGNGGGKQGQASRSRGTCPAFLRLTRRPLGRAAVFATTIVLTAMLISLRPSLGDDTMTDTDRFTKWTHITIAASLPGSAWGTGGIGLADFNGDGRLDVAVSRRETQTAYWFEQCADGSWLRHNIATSPSLANTLGAAALDIDGDGRTDMAFSRVWFRNPGTLGDDPDAPWQAYPYEGGGHDVLAADINGDGRLDVVTYDGHVLAWFDVSRDMERFVIAEGRDDHGGVATHGVGDLNGDGHPDIVLAGVWYENPGGRGEWKAHPWPHKPVEKASYGPSLRSWVADVNGDGWNDIVYSDCDTGCGHVYWVENKGGGRDWVRHQLPDPPGDERTGSWHSLCVADFDGDGLLEIFAGEQEDPDTYMEANGLLAMKPRGLKERGVIWANSGGPTPTFTPVVIHEGRPGWHDAAVADVTGNGRMDIVSKVWNADGPNYHVDLWRNDIDR